jgi:hypothetical protein
MSRKEYKPERAITSAKLKQMLADACKEEYEKCLDEHGRYINREANRRADIVAAGMTASYWKRAWRAKLPDSRNNIRGYVCTVALWSGLPHLEAIAISDPDDQTLIRLAIVPSADEERKKLGVLEIILG